MVSRVVVFGCFASHLLQEILEHFDRYLSPPPLPPGRKLVFTTICYRWHLYFTVCIQKPFAAPFSFFYNLFFELYVKKLLCYSFVSLRGKLAADYKARFK